MTSPFLGREAAVEADGPDAGVPAHYGSPITEQRALVSGSAIVDLSNRGVLSVAGPDRLSWLDSISSQRLVGMPAGGSTETLFLDPSGRIEHAVHLLDDGDTTWLLVEAAAAAPLLAWLDRMRFMLRVEPADRTDEFATIGRLGGAAEADPVGAAAPHGVPLIWRDPWPRVAEGGAQYAASAEHPGAAWIWTETLVERSHLPALAEGELPAAGTLALEALRIEAWRPRWATEVDERSIPHELDWLRSAVHLAKGCYRGQETVAKVHNLGAPPRRLVLLHLDGSDDVLPAPGASVASREAPETTVGVITSSGRHHELGPIALAVVKRSLDAEAEVVVRADDVLVAGSQEVVVPPTAGRAVDVPRLPRIGATKRRA